METKLRQLVVQKRSEKGLSLEELAAAIDCRPYVLKGFEQGLFNLGRENLCRVLRTLSVEETELMTLLGTEAGQALINDCKSLA